jgi:hypothetical protein
LSNKVRKITVIRVCPLKRQITKIFVIRDTKTFGRLLNANAVAQTEVLKFEGKPVILAAAAETPPMAPKFRIKGFGEVAGTAILLGYHADRGCNVPVDIKWTQRMIEWIDG